MNHGRILFVVVLLIIYCTLVFYYKQNLEIEKEEELQLNEEVWREKKVFYEAHRDTLNADIRKYLVHSQDKYRGNTIITDIEPKTAEQEYFPSDRHAIVTMIGSPPFGVNAYWAGALAVVQSLREVKTRIPNIVVMVREHFRQFLPQTVTDAFERLGVKLVNINTVDKNETLTDIPGSWNGAFDKLRVWEMTEYEKVLFLDADTLIVRNIDHLMLHDELTAPYTPSNCNCNADYLISPQFFTISSGFFICEPSLQRYQQMRDLASKPSPDPDDIAQFGGNWHWEIKKCCELYSINLNHVAWNYLHWYYDFPAGMCSCGGRDLSLIYSYHFVCAFPIGKPWQDIRDSLYISENNMCVIDIYHLWFRLLAKAFNNHTHTYANY